MEFKRHQFIIWVVLPIIAGVMTLIGVALLASEGASDIFLLLAGTTLVILGAGYYLSARYIEGSFDDTRELRAILVSFLNLPNNLLATEREFKYHKYIISCMSDDPEKFMKYFSDLTVEGRARLRGACMAVIEDTEKTMNTIRNNPHNQPDYQDLRVQHTNLIIIFERLKEIPTF